MTNAQRILSEAERRTDQSLPCFRNGLYTALAHEINVSMYKRRENVLNDRIVMNAPTSGTNKQHQTRFSSVLQ